MENCLKKTLKAEVNNDSLSRLGEIRIEISGDTSQYLHVNVYNGSYYMRTVGDCKIYNSIGTILRGDYYEFNTNIEYMVKGKGLLFIYDGYISTTLDIKTNETFDIEQVCKRSYLSVLRANSSVIKGDLNMALGTTTTLTSVNFHEANSEKYDIVSMCGNVNLTEYLVGNANGKLEDFVEGLISNGKASGSISMYITGSSVTINDLPFTPSERITVTFNSATNVVVTRTTGSAVIATYSNGAWSYPS